MDKKEEDGHAWFPRKSNKQMTDKEKKRNGEKKERRITALISIEKIVTWTRIK